MNTRHLTHNLTLIFALSLLAALTASLGFTAYCLYDPYSAVCRHPAGGWIAVIGVEALLFGAASWRLWGRLAKRLRGRVYAKPVSAGRPMEFGFVTGGLKALWEGEAAEDDGPRFHPMTSVPPDYGWVVRFDNGRSEVVYWDDFWNWIRTAYEIDQNPNNQAAGVGRRSWPKLRRQQWQARIWLLNLLPPDKVRQTSAAVNAPLRIVDVPWSVMEALWNIWPPVKVKVG